MITCSPAMLETAQRELEQMVPQSGPTADPVPMCITVTSTVANPVGTAQLAADRLSELAEQFEWTTGKREVSFQDFDVVPLYPPDLVDRLGKGHMAVDIRCGACLRRSQ